MKNVLIIDDSRSVHAFVKSCLSSGFRVVSTFNGKEGVEEIERSSPEAYDLILLDWEMPVQDGPMTLKEIRARRPGVRVMMMTSRNSVEDITSMLHLGANEYVMKPFTKEILLEKIMTAFQESA